MTKANDDIEIEWFKKEIFAFFEFDASVKEASLSSNVVGKCKLCPKSNSKLNLGCISRRVRITSNFQKHIKVS